MRKLILLFNLFFLLIFSPLWSQEKAVRTYPVTQKVADNQLKEFIDLFSETNVGNMHLFAQSDQVSNLDYYFKGTEISTAYHRLFSTDWQDFFKKYRVKATAVYQIKGENQAYFIIRTKGPETGERLELFEIQQNSQQLRHKVSLAYADCYNSYCYQQDSWLIDIDGDTRLDLIKKMRVINQINGKIVDSYTNILQQQTDGTFDSSNGLEVEIDDYQFQDLGNNYKLN